MLSGLIGAGAQEGLEEILVRQLKERMAQEEIRQAKAREAQQAKQLALSERGQAFDEQRHRDVMDAQAASRRQRANEAGVEDMFRQRKLMDEQDASASLERELAALLPTLPQNVQQAARVQRAGVTGVTPDDLMTPEQIQARDDAAVKRAARIAAAQRGPASGGERKQWVLRDGKPVHDAPQSGDAPYDKTVANASVSDPSVSATEIARLARSLKEHPGFRSVFGSVQGALPSLREKSVDAEALRDTLISSLTLENVNKLKGVLSDRDMQVLREASTSLRPRMGDAAAAAELERIIQTVGRAGAPTPAPSHEAGTGAITHRWDGKKLVPVK